MIVYLAGAIQAFVMYYVNGTSRSSLLIESVDSMIVVGNRVFQQHIGIPMGTDCAPLLVNLYLFYYEYNYMKNLMKLDYGKALKFNFTVRYIDNLLTLNNTLL